jgi:hypothetical protein
MGLHEHALRPDTRRAMKHPNRALAAALALFASAALSCAGRPVKGNGVVTSEARALGDFTGVSVANGLRANVSVGATSVKVHADQNLQEYIETSVSGGTLVVAVTNGFDLQPTQPLVVTVVSPTVLSFVAAGSAVIAGAPSAGNVTVDASGSSDVSLANVAAETIDVKGSGGSTVTVAGADAAATKVVVSGGGTLRLPLHTKVLTFDASESSAIDAYVTDTVRGTASGRSRVTIAGPSLTHETTTSGEATITYVP